MPIDVQAFRNAAALGGYVTLREGEQGEALATGGKGTWLKSVLNIGTARADNLATLEALRDAIVNDPAFSEARNDARALLNGMSSSRPLKAGDVARILDDMQALSAQRVKQAAHTVAMRELSPENMGQSLETAFQSQGLSLDRLPATARSSFIRAMSAAVAERVGDGSDPNAVSGLREMLLEKTEAFARMCGDVLRSEVRDVTKNILLGQICENGRMKDPELMRSYITLRENQQANGALIQQASDISLPDSALAKALDAALKKEGFSDVPAQACMETLSAAIGDRLSKLAQPNPNGPVARLTPAQAEAARDAAVSQFVGALKQAKGQARPSDAAFLARLVLEQDFPMSAEVVRLLADNADKVQPSEFLSLLGKDPAGIMGELSQLGVKLQPMYEALPKKLLPEGLAGRNFFINAICGLALGRAGLTRAQLEKAERFLDSPGVRALRQGLDADYSNPVSISNLNQLDSLHGLLARMLGISPEEYSERSVLPPISLSEAPVDVRLAVDPQTQVFKGAELFAEVVPAELRASAKELSAGQVQTALQYAIAKDLWLFTRPAPTDVTQMGKDLARGFDVHVDGVRINTDTSTLPGIDNALVELADGALETFAKMRFGRNVGELTENEKLQAMAFAGVSSQQAVNNLVTAVCQSLLGEGAFTAGPAEDVQMGVSLTSLPSGDVAVRVEVKKPVRMLSVNEDSVMLDPGKSGVEGVLAFTIPAGGPKQLADSFAAWKGTEGYAAWVQTGGKDLSKLPAGMMMPITGLRFDGAITAVPPAE